MRDDYELGSKFICIDGLEIGETFTIISECYQCSLFHIQYDVINDRTGIVTFIDSQNFENYFIHEDRKEN